MNDGRQTRADSALSCAVTGCVTAAILVGPLWQVLFPVTFIILVIVTPRPRSWRQLPWWIARAAFHATMGPVFAPFFWAEEVGKREGKSAHEVLMQRLGRRAAPAGEEQS